VEQRDSTCRPTLGYGRPLLYLVSESFEHAIQTRILGMARYFDKDPDIQQALAMSAKRRIQIFSAPGADPGSTTHGGFDDDVKTMNTTIKKIKTAV
jgi:hypothetical protein